MMTWKTKLSNKVIDENTISQHKRTYKKKTQTNEEENKKCESH